MARFRDDEFVDGTPGDRWHVARPGGATLAIAGSVLRCAIPATPAGSYANAQIDDYDGARLRDYPWRPPLRLEVRARTSLPVHPPDGPPWDAPPGTTQRYLRGTAGFGFWNAPLTMGAGALRLPDAVWFFAASPPSDMRLVPGIVGRGWKAQVVHAHRAGALALAPAALAAAGWARLSGRERAARRVVQRLTGASEAIVNADATGWHDYSIEWLPQRAIFAMDGVEVLCAVRPPRGPLGFVAWIDNQYAVATPRGQLRFGTLATGPQALEIDHIRITADTPAPAN
ncbi:MAG: hypothetical protein ACHQ4H_02385 [Ktedonobacterales bacterium]